MGKRKSSLLTAEQKRHLQYLVNHGGVCEKYIDSNGLQKCWENCLLHVNAKYYRKVLKEPVDTGIPAIFSHPSKCNTGTAKRAAELELERDEMRKNLDFIKGL